METGKNKIEWTKATILHLIEMWESYEELYNPRHKLYNNRQARQQILCEFSKVLKPFFPNITPTEVKEKINYLRGQYSRELSKIKATSGLSDEEAYVPCAYWFEKLYFLKPFIKVRTGRNLNCKQGDDVDLLEPKEESPTTVRPKRKNQPDSNPAKDCHSGKTIKNVQTMILPTPQQISPPGTPGSSIKRLRLCDAQQNDTNSQQSNANELITTLTEALTKIAPKKSNDQDEAFCNFLKVELSQLRSEIKDELKEEISLLLFKAKKKQRTSTSDKFEDESIVVELYR